MLGKLLGAKGNVLGIFQDVGPAFELNQGQNFYAYLAGLGGNLALPAPYVVGLNLYYRYDKFVGDGWQVTPFWGLPFQVGPVGLAFAGFADLAAAETAAGSDSVDLMTQPQLLVDVGALWNQPRRWWLGTEWWLHYNPVKSSQSAQLLFQWTIR
jgi:nucleoside-specific outer membrane channel protein Tsx